MTYYVGIDIGGTNVKFGLVTETGEILADGKVSTNHNGAELIQTIKGIVSKYQQEYLITAVGLSVPGVVEENGFLTTGGSIQDFYGIDLKGLLEETLSLPVFVENDANSAALAEKWLGAGKDYQHMLCVVVGTGIGGGIILNGELFRGAHSNAGEFGFMVVQPIKNHDTRLATLSLTGSVQCGVVSPYEVSQQGHETNQLDGETVFRLAAEGDVVAQELIDVFYDRLALGIFNIGISFDPEIVLIGGAISSNQAFMKELERRVNLLKEGHIDMGNVQLPQIRSCQFFNQAGIIGAVYRSITALAKEAK
ncbi:ROK family protein [Vagococcus sp. BWB3-3]|uniref:ROK family protein n=1 Tax=Vagococcus allomyrinae TaxID=2794353 RepID=A0A940SV31_9ENTE|nr:ROK family protein [Vagococcus allomyrinae]MBP1039928.1 ROK family protein [Vagococcus allomyrinae]